MSGDRDFENLLNDHLPALRAFVRLRTSHKLRQMESHVDLVQSICREALGAQERFDFQGDTAFKNWLFTFAKRKLVERDRYWHYDKRDVRRVQPNRGGEEGNEWQLIDQYATFATPTRILGSREEMARIEAAFDQLSDAQREVIALVRVAGLSHAEAADAMDSTEENSRQLLRRGLVRLSIVLDEMEQAERKENTGPDAEPGPAVDNN